jgi:hypothetical protein
VKGLDASELLFIEQLQLRELRSAGLHREGCDVEDGELAVHQMARWTGCFPPEVAIVSVMWPVFVLNSCRVLTWPCAGFLDIVWNGLFSCVLIVIFCNGRKWCAWCTDTAP